MFAQQVTTAEVLQKGRQNCGNIGDTASSYLYLSLHISYFTHKKMAFEKKYYIWRVIKRYGLQAPITCYKLVFIPKIWTNQK